MESSEIPIQVDDINTSSSLIGKTVEGNVVIDQGAWLAEAKSAIASQNPSSDQDAIAFAERYVRDHLQDAIFAFQSAPETYQQHKAAIDRVLTSNKPRPISEVLEGGFGVCPDFQALELALLDQMGLEAYLAGSPSRQHLFVFVKQDDKWVISDPYAESYFKVRGSNNQRFSADYYQGDIKLFDKTSSAGEPPEIPSTRIKSNSPQTISLADLKARAAVRK